MKKDETIAMDQHKKRKTRIPVWRPVSTQSSPNEEYVVKVEKMNMENENEAVQVQVQVVSHSTSDSRSGVSSNVIEENLQQSECDTSDPHSSETIWLEQTKDDNIKEVDTSVKDHMVGSGNCSASIEVDASLIRFIKGKGGCTQNQIEEETGVKIIFPSSKVETSIVIEGNSIENVNRASEMIQAVLDQAIKSPNLDYSHFVSLPLAIHPGLVEKLTDFQNSILGSTDCSLDGNLGSDSDGDSSDGAKDKHNQLEGDPSVAVKLNIQALGIDRSIFIKPKTFHLTVLVLKLWNKERLAKASEVLQRISSKVIDALDGRPVSVRLKGLECMKGSLSKARVLYAPIEEIGGEERLLRACQVIIEAYVEAGLVLEKDANQKLKLHATVMNARHRKRKKRMKRYDSFDARNIYKKYGSEEWGEYLIREAHLSQRFAFDDNGYYHCCASISFPENMQIE